MAQRHGCVSLYFGPKSLVLRRLNSISADLEKAGQKTSLSRVARYLITRSLMEDQNTLIQEVLQKK